jgi:hypothetical protein
MPIVNHTALLLVLVISSWEACAASRPATSPSSAVLMQLLRGGVIGRICRKGFGFGLLLLYSLHGSIQRLFVQTGADRYLPELRPLVRIRRNFNGAIRQGFDFADLEGSFVEIHVARPLRARYPDVPEIVLEAPLGFEVVHLDFERDGVQPSADAGCILRAVPQAQQ